MEAGQTDRLPTKPHDIRAVSVMVGGSVGGDGASDGRASTVAPGETFEFGRNPGPGQIGADDPTISRVHGLVRNYGDHWEATSTGSYVGLVIHDADSDDAIEIRAGAGPYTVPYRSAVIVIPARQHYVMTVDSPHEPGYSFRPGDPPEDFDKSGPSVTNDDCFDSKGVPLPWFLTLVALCEPELRNGRSPAPIPTVEDLQCRLERSADEVRAALREAWSRLGFVRQDSVTLTALAKTARHESIVRTPHLDLLPPFTV